MVPHSVFFEMVSTSWAPLFGMVFPKIRTPFAQASLRLFCNTNSKTVTVPTRIRNVPHGDYAIMYPGTLFRPSPKPF